MKNKYWIIFALMLFLVFYKFIFDSGYYFSLDLALNPNGWWPSWGSHLWWVGVLSKLFVFLGVKIWILQKLIFFIGLSTLIYGGYLSLKNIRNDKVKLFGLLFLVFNPFFYDRFIDGQWNIWLSYCFYPLFFYFIYNFYEKLKFKYLLGIGIISLLLNLTSTHNVIFIGFIIGLFSFIYLFKYKQIFYFKKILLLGITIFLLNIWWVIPSFISQNTFGLVKITDNFNNNDFQAFKFCVKKDENIYLKPLELKGYWGECMYRFYDANQIGGKYSYAIFFIYFLVLLGLYFRFKNKKNIYFDMSLLFLFLISYILTFGNSNNNIFSGITNLLYNDLPFYKGFREPQKWIIFIVFIYFWFSIWGLKYLIIKYNKTKWINYIIWFLIFTPIFYSYNFLFSFHGQVKLTQYPKDWQEIRSITYNDLNKCKTKYCGIVFPWHSYIGIEWVGKKTLSGISNYFGSNLLLADNVEIGKIYSQSIRSESKIIEKYIGSGGIFRKKYEKKYLKSFIWNIKKMGIRNIILLKEVDWKIYKDFLDNLVNNGYLESIKENDMLILYRVK